MSVAASAQTITHFSYASHTESWQQFLREAAKKFEEQTGIVVEVVTSTGNYPEQVQVMIAGGTPPDVTDFHPMIGAPLIQQGLFEDLRPYVDRSGIDLTQYPPVAIEGVTDPSGVMWGFPMSVFPVVTFFNHDLFEEAGLVNPVALGDNWTWETFRESARRLTVDTNGDGNPDQWGSDPRIAARWEQWVHQAGGQWFDRLVFPTESQFNSAEVLEAVRFVTQLMHEDRVVAPTAAQNYLFNGNGNVGMSTVDGPGLIGTYMQDIPFRWDVALQPHGPANRAARVNPDGFQILKSSENKDAAWRWIEFLVGNLESHRDFAAITGRIPSLRDAMIEYDRVPLTMPPNWMAFIETAFDPNGYAAYVIPATVQSAINSAMAQVWNGNTPPEEALEQLHSVVNALLAEEQAK